MGQDPQKTAIAAGIVGTSSVIAGQYALIVLAALFGALVALSREGQTSAQSGAAFIFRAVSISAFTTMFATGWLYTRYPELSALPAHSVIMAAAFLIAMVGDGWFRIKDWLLQKIGK